MTVMVAHPKAVKSLRSSYRFWVYADANEDCYWRLLRIVAPKSRPLMTPAEYQSWATTLRPSFVSWVDECLEFAAYEAWLTTPLYKNPLDNTLFLHFCWLCAIDARLAAGERDILIISESSGLATVIETICRKYGLQCLVTGKTYMRMTYARRYLTATGRFIANILSVFWRMLLARLILRRQQKQRLQDIELLIDSYVMADDVDSNGSFHDRYFPKLIDFYERHSFTSGICPYLYGVSPLRVPGLYLRFSRSRVLFLPFELFVSVIDLIAAMRSACAGVRSPLKIAVLNQGINLDGLVRWLQPFSALHAFTALLMFRFPAKLNANGIRPRWLVDWYENQPHDKALAAGFRAAGSSCKVFAVRQYPPMYNFLSLYTTSGEVKAGVSPAENWVCGRAHIDAMSVYDRLGTYKVVPALRYSDVHKDVDLSVSCNSLLVLMPYSLADAHAILRCLIPALSTLAENFDRVILKAHPTASQSTLERYIEKYWLGSSLKIEWSNETVGALLPSARVVVSTQSSAMLEAICIGAWVIVVGRSAGITVNPLEDIDRRLWRLVYDSGELLEAIQEGNSHHALSRPERIAIGNSIRLAHFEPTNEISMRAFLPACADKAVNGSVQL